MTVEPKLPKPRTVPVDKVGEMEETRDVRARGIDPEHVNRMVPFIAELPPVDVVALAGGRFGILSGYHRLRAHHEDKRKTIKVLVHDLAPEEWFAFAVRSNVAHGVPLTLAERKTAARKMIALGDHRSSRAIAKDCGLSDKTVEALRHGEESTAEAPQLRVGRDGKTRQMPTPRAGEGPPEETWAETLDRLVELEATIKATDATSAELRAGMLEEEPELPFIATDRDEDASPAAAAREILDARLISSYQDWSDAADRLTRALSYALSYRPPRSIPDRYISVDEFRDRVRRLQKATDEWEQP